jgi:uncharacterized protein (DUF58 family)
MATMQLVSKVLRSFAAMRSGRRISAQREVVLVRHHIFILPTRFGVLFAVVLLLMLTGSINYALSLGYILTFLLAALSVSAILHTFRNLAGLRLTSGRTPPVFAGDVAQFHVRVSNATRAERCSVALASDKRNVTMVDVPPESVVIATTAVAAKRRGVLRAGKLTVSTRFPVGLFRAWSYVHLDTQCIVYPRPAPAGLPLPRSNAGANDAAGAARGTEDFAGLRPYHPGDSPGHIAWKAAARGQSLLTKQFDGRAEAELWLSPDQLPASLDVEEKLSRLARWVLEAHSAGVPYGLSLPGAIVPLGRGAPHRERCLEALALFEPDRHASRS